MKGFGNSGVPVVAPYETDAQDGYRTRDLSDADAGDLRLTT
ncbi:hypothetical protein [Breoghania sp.]|nr:hypothetical protein [Breoghania sp.]MDJ0930072.1 hypothetical protein [Breoghania sp.]